jgi:hypothetical protein
VLIVAGRVPLRKPDHLETSLGGHPDFCSACQQVSAHPRDRNASWMSAARRSALESGETDSARQTYARRPSGTDPAHSHARCGARPTRARCGAPVDRTGLFPNRPVTQHAVRTTAGSPSFALERRNRIDEQQRFLRIMPAGSGQADREGHAPAVADQMTFAASLGSIGGIRTNLRPTTHRPHGAAIDLRSVD